MYHIPWQMDVNYGMAAWIKFFPMSIFIFFLVNYLSWNTKQKKMYVF